MTATKKFGSKLLVLALALIMVVGLAIPAFAANYIGNADAKEIALKHAGVSQSSVKKIECELDRERGVMIYEVEFKTTNRMEYEYNINATTGAIINYKNSGGGRSTTGTTSYIGAAAAKEIALKHAGVSQSSVKKIECELDRERGVMIYEVEFKTTNRMEYEYDINAETGAIIKYDVERD